MEEKTTSILHFHEAHWPDELAALKLLGQFSLDEFGEGGRPDETNVNNIIGFANSDISGHFVRVQIGKAYGQALEFIQANYPSDIAELIRVEWFGQDMVDSGEVDEAGQPIYVEQLFQTGTYLDDQGVEHPVYLGRF